MVGAGALPILLGIFAIVAAFLASVAINAWIDVAFLIAGIGRLVRAAQGERRTRSLGHVLGGSPMPSAVGWWPSTRWPGSWPSRW
jgi:uncharacterized membrane protein HdeD (DUF308 family)